MGERFTFVLEIVLCSSVSRVECCWFGVSHGVTEQCSADAGVTPSPSIEERLDYLTSLPEADREHPVGLRTWHPSPAAYKYRAAGLNFPCSPPVAFNSSKVTIWQRGHFLYSSQQSALLCGRTSLFMLFNHILTYFILSCIILFYLKRSVPDH